MILIHTNLRISLSKIVHRNLQLWASGCRPAMHRLQKASEGCFGGSCCVVSPYIRCWLLLSLIFSLFSSHFIVISLLSSLVCPPSPSCSFVIWLEMFPSWFSIQLSYPSSLTLSFGSSKPSTPHYINLSLSWAIINFNKLGRCIPVTGRTGTQTLSIFPGAEWHCFCLGFPSFASRTDGPGRVWWDDRIFYYIFVMIF
jgi:hypothetical protein